MRTQVGIVGAGPAGLLLAHLLHLEGIESVILERQSQRYVQERVRAGVIEHAPVNLLKSAGVGARLEKEGLEHDGIELLFGKKRHRIDLAELTGGKRITVYGQQEVVKDLIAARQGFGQPILFEVDQLTLEGIDGERPKILYRHAGQQHELVCDYVAGCDGFHGMARGCLPPALTKIFERVYPFAWLGILAAAAPASEELIYASHAHGFALFSMRSPTITRLYLQCEPDEDITQWSDDRIWNELYTRLATDDDWKPNYGPILQKGVTPMRSFVCETMQHGRLFLAGDAAHIVPPTGAKGMNLAIADVRNLARAFTSFYKTGKSELLDSYSVTCLPRVWRSEHFSWWMTSMMHRFESNSSFQTRIQEAERNYVVSSRAAATTLAENYVGLPFPD